MTGHLVSMVSEPSPPNVLPVDSDSNAKFGPGHAAAPIDRPMVALRIVQFGMLTGLAWKFGYFRIGDNVYHEIPLWQEFFPLWFQNADVLRWSYVTACVATVVTAWIAQGRWRLLAAGVGLASLSILCLHQGTYNDMTFVTAWWCALWSLWLSVRMEHDDPDQLMDKAAHLGQLILAVVLLGGAVGKWTGEYWSGQVLYDIYFVDRDYWFFNFLRSTLETDDLRRVATWYSRLVVASETLGSILIWTLPTRFSALVGVLIFFSIAAMSNFWLFSVLNPLIALSAVGFLVRSRTTS